MPFSMEPVEIKRLLTDVVERLREQLDERHPVRVEATADIPLIEADPDRLDQVFTNLLDNASKYSPEGGEIVVSLTATDDLVTLTVSDSGIGVPVEAQETIFEPFGRAANATTMHLPGMGLGLYICRQIVERHGGRLWAESEGVNRGTRFVVQLPVAAASAAAEQPQTGVPAGA
jgi:signal transduction histidine kinase